MCQDINSRIIEIEDDVFGKMKVGYITHDTNNNGIIFKLFKKPYIIKNDLEFNYRDQTTVDAIYNCMLELSSKVNAELYGDYELYDKICRSIIKLNFKEILNYRPKTNSKFRVLYSISQGDCTVHFVEDSLEIKGNGIFFFNEKNSHSRVFCDERIGKSIRLKGNESFIIASYFEKVFNNECVEKTTDDYRVFFELADLDGEIEEDTFYIKNTGQGSNETSTTRNSSNDTISLSNYIPSTGISINDICAAKTFLVHLPTINHNSLKCCRIVFLSKKDSEKSLK